MLKDLLNLLVRLLRAFYPKKIEEMEYIPLTKESAEEIKSKLEPMLSEKFLKICLDALDTDPSTPDGVKDEVGCADTLSTLLKKVFPDFPIIYSTKELDWKLFSDKRFERITEPEMGCIIVSPRTNTVYGHTGVFITSERIASNNSKTGLFQGNYTWDSWIREFKTCRGLRVYLYKIKD